jgi:hypothetical protein
MSGHQRPALDVLAELRRGRLHTELTDALHELLKSCQDTGKKGSLTLTLTIEPEKVSDYETPRIKVTDQVGMKKPRKSVQPSTFFLTDDGVPVRRDPNQEAFESLREVPNTPADADAATTRKAN